MRRDQDMLDNLQGHGYVALSLRFYCLMRNGNLLLALPKDKKIAALTLRLYQPQSYKAKLLVKWVAVLVKFGAHLLLPSFNVRVGGDSALADLIKRDEQLGILLGNPEGKSRKAIAVYHNANEIVVAKIGIGKAAKRSVQKEAAMIESLPENYLGIAAVKKCFGHADWYYYTTPFIVGDSPVQKQDSQVLALLDDWVRHFTLKRLRDTQIWESLKFHERLGGRKGYSDFIERLGELDVKVGLYHGDFAPWNIKISEGGVVNVMDWEYARLDGLAGWDWLHYMIQRVMLVDGASLDDAIADCCKWADTEQGALFLHNTGWGKNVDLWIGSYLIYSSWVDGFDRAEGSLERICADIAAHRAICR
jgi:hypothetical protein